MTPSLLRFLSVALPGLIASISGAAGKPNILFLFTDDQRADTIHALGNEHIKTPNIDRIVKEGLSFDNAYIMGATSMAVCTPSRACLFSGRTLWNLESQGPWDFAISGRYRTMTQVFREGGYTTFATGKNDPGFGKNDHFMRSFSEGDMLYYRGGHRGQNQTPLFSFPKSGSPTKEDDQPGDGTFNADLFSNACVAFLISRKDVPEPFFAYVPFMTPHDPLNCPEDYLAMYEADAMKLPANFMPEHPFNAGVHDIRDEKLMKRPLTEEKLRKRLAKYYALVTHTDAQIGRILNALESSGHADNTIIIFSSDNGLALGSHGLTGKQNLYEHSVKIPLVISGPGIPKDQRRTQLCYLYDIYPTLCDIAGIEVPDTVQYQSLNPVIENAGAKGRKQLSFAFMQWQRAVRDEQYKLIEFCVNGLRTTRLYDLIEDPSELKDLAGDERFKPTLIRLRTLLQSERKRLNDGASDAPHLIKMSGEFWKTFEPQKE